VNTLVQLGADLIIGVVLFVVASFAVLCALDGHAE
jgi:hypothetical protein